MSIDDYFRQSFESIKRENCETRISNVNCNTTMTLSSIITVVIECVLCLFWDLITFYKCARGYACGFSVFFTRFHHRHTLGRLELKIKNKTKPKKKVRCTLNVKEAPDISHILSSLSSVLPPENVYPQSFT